MTPIERPASAVCGEIRNRQLRPVEPLGRVCQLSLAVEAVIAAGDTKLEAVLRH